MSSVRAICDLESLDGIQLTWNALLGETQDATYFQTFTWFRFVVSRQSSGTTPYVLVVRSAGRPIGILPFVRHIRGKRSTSGRCLTSPIAPPAAPFRPLGRNATATLIAAARYLRRHEREWDDMAIFGLDRDGWNRGRMEDAFANAGFQVDRDTCPADWYAACRTTSESEQLTSTSTIDPIVDEWVRRDAPGLTVASAENDDPTANFDWTHLHPEPARFGDGDPNWPMFDLAWRGLNEGVIEGWPLSTGRNHDAGRIQTQPLTLSEIHERAANDGSADLLVLNENGIPVASTYHLVHDGVAFHLLSAFRDRAAQIRLRDTLRREFQRRFAKAGGRWVETSTSEPTIGESPAGHIRRRAVGCTARVTARHQIQRVLRWLKIRRARVS